ncbi:hypothetical protein BCEN4_740151 [Burkholderia cenocepacia]|nr:hypothetical protein BCEN4_740151 [Burkholderia cenocepacia]
MSWSSSEQVKDWVAVSVWINRFRHLHNGLDMSHW